MSVRTLCAAVVASAFILTGCTVRYYPAQRDRVDQDLTTGNHGYLKGEPKSSEILTDRPTTRQTHTLEVEVKPWFMLGKKKAPVSQPVQQPEASTNEQQVQAEQVTPPTAETTYEEYTVQKGDTLQKISQKYFGTTRKWQMLFELNKIVLKTPNSVYPGQKLRIPVINKVSPDQGKLK